MMRELYSNGHKLDLCPETYGQLRDSNDVLDDPQALEARMAEDGYWLFRGLIGRNAVLEARREILLKYAVIGEIDAINHPLMEGVHSQDSAIDKVNLLAFTESVRTGQAYERVVLDEALTGLLKRSLGGAVCCFDFKWPRLVRPGETCGLHCDAPYVNRGSRNVVTAWIPLGDLAREEGALIILEGSHRNEIVRRRYAHKDADRDHLGWLSTNPITLQKNLGGRWLTTDFRAGDVLLFSMFLVHGALDNHSRTNRCRLTSDTRYQLAGEPLDERWNGDQPKLHGGRRVFLPGLGSWKNRNFQDEWKSVDERGRLVTT
jgi:hypothetical protein